MGSHGIRGLGQETGDQHFRDLVKKRKSANEDTKRIWSQGKVS